MAAEVIREFVNRDGVGVVDVVRLPDRQVFLTIGGETAFQTGWDICDTCRYIFSKVHGAQRLTDGSSREVADELSAALQNVRTMPDIEVLGKFASVLAPGAYTVALANLRPALVMPGAEGDYFTHEAVATWGVDPYFGVGHFPNTPYYRLGTVDMGALHHTSNRLGVILGAPLFPPTQEIMNSQEVIASYRAILRDEAAKPTVLALGLVDERGPAVWGDPAPQFTRHLIVTLFILDGHHKIAAAAADGLPIQFLVFAPHSHLGRDWQEVVDEGVDLLVSQAA